MVVLERVFREVVLTFIQSPCYCVEYVKFSVNSEAFGEIVVLTLIRKNAVEL